MCRKYFFRENEITIVTNSIKPRHRTTLQGDLDSPCSGFHLPFLNHRHGFNSTQRFLCRIETLKSHHRICQAFDASMVLLNDAVQVRLDYSVLNTHYSRKGAVAKQFARFLGNSNGPQYQTPGFLFYEALKQIGK